MIAFSRTGWRNLNRGKVDADDEAGKTVKPVSAWSAGLGRIDGTDRADGLHNRLTTSSDHMVYTDTDP